MNTSLYGRKWELKIECNDGEVYTVGNDGFKTGHESLKCSFEVNYPGYQGWYFSEFTIFNLERETERKLIQEGARVYFSAGYSDGNYGLIFSGTVFQSMFSRENVTDYKLVLWCMDGERLFKDNFINFTLGKYSDMTLTNALAGRSDRPISVGRISPRVSKEDSIRGATFFGAVQNPLRDINKISNTVSFMKNDQVHVVSIMDAPNTSAIEIGPKTGLIGTPVQIDYGVSFRCLLNPELMLTNPLRWVKLDLSGVGFKQQRADLGGKMLSTVPTDGYFKIGGVRHIGDTRGNDYYTDVTGYSLAGKLPFELQLPEYLQNGDMKP